MALATAGKAILFVASAVGRHPSERCCVSTR